MIIYLKIKNGYVILGLFPQKVFKSYDNRVYRHVSGDGQTCNEQDGSSRLGGDDDGVDNRVEKSEYRESEKEEAGHCDGRSDPQIGKSAAPKDRNVLEVVLVRPITKFCKSCGQKQQQTFSFSRLHRAPPPDLPC
jgi:hypothetical protein